MKHYLTFKDDKSDKFWQIETEGKSFTVTYGKTGSVGVTKIKEFANAEKCEQEAAKLLAEKIKKGYTESDVNKPKTESFKPSTSAAQNYLESWKSIVKSKKLSQSLVSHFSFFADTPACEKIIVDFFKNAKQAKIIDDSLEITFLIMDEGDESEYVLRCEKPYDGEIDSSVPASYAAIARYHNGISWEGADVPFTFNGITDGLVSSSLHYDFIVNDATFAKKMEQKGHDINSVVAPITNCQDWFIFNPLIESCGEPALCAVSHNDGLIENPVTTQWNFKGAFLRILASLILPQVSWSKSTAKIEKINFELQYQIKRYVRKAVTHTDKLITIQTKIRAELQPYYPGAGNQIAIYDLKTGRELCSLTLDARPFDVVVDGDVLYLFCVHYGKTENKFLLNSYKISNSQTVAFCKTLEETIVEEKHFKKCGTNNVAENSSLFLLDSALVFFFSAFNDTKFKQHEIKVFNLKNNDDRFTYKFPETFVRSVCQMDGKLFCEIDLKTITRLDVSATTLKREPWFDVDCRGIFCIINDFVYAQIDFNIVVFDNQGKQLFIYKNPDSYGIDYFYSFDNILLSKTGYFYSVINDGQLVPIKANIQPRLINDHHEKIGLSKDYLLIQRELHSAKPEKELLFEVYTITSADVN